MATTKTTLQPGDVLEVTAAAAPVPAPTPPPAPTPTPTPTPTPATGRQTLGLNLASPWEGNIGSRTKLFNDLALTGRFIGGDSLTGASQFRFLTVSDGVRTAKVQGLYTLKATTTGTVTCNTGPVVKLSADTWQVNVQRDDDSTLSFSAPVTMKAIWRPGADSAKTCSTEFLTFVKPFAFIRFMDLMTTNWADATDAAERVKTLGTDGMMQWGERPSDTERFNRPWGISVEAAIRICNESKKDMWLCMPHVATDQYATALAAELKAKLDPTLNVYLEFSNEVWNYAGGFHHSTLIKDTAVAYVAAGKTPKLDNPADNEWYYAQRYALLRLHDMAAILAASLGARVRPIFASQLASGNFGNALMWGKRTWGNNDWLYGLACAPYIWADVGTVTDILNGLTVDYKTRQAAASKLAHMRALCDAHLKNNNLFFYEMGIDMGQGDTNLANRIAAAYDPGIANVVMGFLRTNVADKGVHGAAWFNGCSARDKFGPAWGLTDDASDLAQPMYVSAAAFAGQTAQASGVTAEFYKNTDFTVLLEKKVTRLIDHAWQSWATAPMHHGQNPTWTEGKDGAIRFTGRYLGTGTLKAVCETNDSATLTVRPDKTFVLDYVARFAGNGSCFVQLQDGAGVVPTSMLSPT